ncbi:helix-turn-helix domain-containing protein [Streptomyces niveus]|uniref:helix-turn-helix domain-containing protein n=1 Tax=Streptomyces niveus TaxID=193462 RepID=UPI00368AAD7A
MSTVYLDRALDAVADISPTERLVLVLLGRAANPDGLAFPTVGHLAKAVNVSPTTVTHAVSRLAELGLIQLASSRTTTGATSTTVYRLTIENLAGQRSEGARA